MKIKQHLDTERAWILYTVALLVCLFGNKILAQDSLLMYIEGIPGDLTSKPFENWHGLWSFDQEFSTANPSTGDVQYVGDAVHGLYEISKPVNRGTVPITTAFLGETPISEVTIAFAIQGHPPSEYLRVTLENVYLIRQEIERLPGEDPPLNIEHISFAAGTATWADTEIGPMLALSLASFTVTRAGDDALVQWTTMLEHGLTHFEIQRQLSEGFVTVASCDATGFSMTPEHYTVRIPDMGAGRHVFRLKTVSLDGSAEYGGLEEVTFDLKGEPIRLTTPHPNPASHRILFDLSIEVNQDIRVSVFDILGREQSVLHDGHLNGGQRHAFDFRTDHLPNGLYLLRIVGRRIDESRAFSIAR